MEISHIIFKQTPKNETLYPLELYFLLHADKRIRFFLYVYLCMLCITFKEATNHLSGRRLIILHKAKKITERRHHIYQVMPKSR